MKEIIMISILLLIQSVVSGQSKIGASASVIKKEFRKKKYYLNECTDKYNVYYISILTEKSTIIYHFNKDKICTTTTILPFNKDDFEYYLKLYNQQFIKDTEIKWRVIANNNETVIRLYYEEYGHHFFVWSER